MATAAAVVGAVAGTSDVVIWFILLAALSLLAQPRPPTSRGPLCSSSAGGTILFDHTMISSPVSSAMDTVGLRTAICASAVAWLVFVLLPGPKDS
ncbi:MAG: hypothetical protein ACYDDU_16935 [Dermatophilaceae bacterium]